MRHLLPVLAVAGLAVAPAGIASASCYEGHTAAMSVKDKVAKISTPVVEEEAVTTHEETPEIKPEARPAE